MGDVVLVKGTVRINKDFGSGYTYAVIVGTPRSVIRLSIRAGHTTASIYKWTRQILHQIVAGSTFS